MTIPAHLLGNPLVNPPEMPYGAPPYGFVKPEHIIPAVDWAIERQREEINAIKSSVDLPTFANTSETLEFSGSDLLRIHGVVHAFFTAQVTDEMRVIKEAVEDKLNKVSNDISMDEVLFARLHAVYTARATLNLSTEETRLLEEQHRGFIDTGVNLDPACKQRIREIDERLSALTNKFRENEAKSLAAYSQLITDPAALDGLPEKYKEKMAQDAADAGHPGQWLVKIDPYPVAIWKYCKNRVLREDTYRACMNVAVTDPYDNRPLALEILGLRYELAQIKGYKNYAEMALSNRMAGTTQTVHDFLDYCLKIYKPAAEQYVDRLRALALADDGISSLQAWDVMHYGTRLKEKECSIDTQDFEKYLNLEKVIAGLNCHLERQFDIELRDETAKYSTYDPDVKVYEVHRRDGGGIVGLLYTDYYARGETKDSGAWMSDVRNRGLYQGVDMIPVATNNCNFIKPQKGQPTFITIEDYVTLYHEAGHALHCLLSRAKYPSLAGTNVKLDWVEGPSQFQENYALQKQVLDTFAVHHDTHQPIPDSLVRAVNDYSNFDAGWQGLRQIGFCLMDMKAYDADPATITSLESIEESVKALTSVLPPVPTCQMASFTHIFDGQYAAGYYSYKWAEVIDKHIFRVVTRNGLYDRAAMKDIEQHLYGSGNICDPMECFIAITGSKPDPDMLFRHEGLLPPPVAAAAAPALQKLVP